MLFEMSPRYGTLVFIVGLLPDVHVYDVLLTPEGIISDSVIAGCA